MNVQGWKLYAVKEKMKALKIKIKSWSRETFGGLDAKIEELVSEMDVLDTNMIEGQIQCSDQRRLLSEESGDELDRKKACYFRNPGSDGLNWETLIAGIFILI